MLNGLSLFTGYGGIDLALSEWVRPILYCDIEPYAQGILLSRMDDGSIPFAPIWNDVTTLDGRKFRGLVDIAYGGFPCQDISVAGKGAGLEGKRSGLFFEIIRICKEASPLFIFLENVPAIRTRGAIEVTEALASIGYDCRWHHLSAAEVGANHKRERWFLLAHANPAGQGLQGSSGAKSELGELARLSNSETVADANGSGCKWENSPQAKEWDSDAEFAWPDRKEVADTDMQGRGRETATRSQEDNQGVRQGYGRSASTAVDSSWWETEPFVGRVAHGTTFRAHRIKALGNGVVPLQVKTAFEILMGLSRSSE